MVIFKGVTCGLFTVKLPLITVHSLQSHKIKINGKKNLHVTGIAAINIQYSENLKKNISLNIILNKSVNVIIYIYMRYSCPTW